MITMQPRSRTACAAILATMFLGSLAAAHAAPKESSSFLKKTTKKLLDMARIFQGKAEARSEKVFCFFFFKKEGLAF